MEYTFIGSLWIRNNWKAPASWHFITVPQDISNDIKQFVSTQPRKWRWSVRVEVRIGFYVWKTSIFPDKKSWCYLLPIKADVRKKLQIKENDEINCVLHVLVWY